MDKTVGYFYLKKEILSEAFSSRNFLKKLALFLVPIFYTIFE